MGFGLLALLLLAASFACSDLPKGFLLVLNRAHMVFASPQGLVPTQVVPNKLMAYDYAMKYPDKHYEVRYAIRPLDKVMAEYHERIDKGDFVSDPNKWYTMNLQAVLMNVSGKRLPPVDQMTAQSAKIQFNADWGATAVVPMDSTFGMGYNYCMMIALHKDNVADAYVFFMTDSMSGFDEYLMPVFYSLKFK